MMITFFLYLKFLTLINMLGEIFGYLVKSISLSNNLIRIKYCFIIAIFFSPHLFSQDILLQGKVIDKLTNESINAVSVVEKASLKGSTTNKTGSFKLFLPIGIHQMEFSHIGYFKIDTTLDLSVIVRFIFISALGLFPLKK